MTEPVEDPERHYLDDDANGALFGGESGSSRDRSSGTNAGLIAGDRADPVLVCGIGYPLLGDMAVGTVVAHRVASWDVPGVAVADCSHTPIAAYQTITDGDYRAVLLVGAEKRGGDLNDGQPSTDPGAIHEFGPDAVDVPQDRLADLVGQTAMGLNTVENVVVITSVFGTFPDRTRIITVEPAYDSWGPAVDDFTDPVADALEPVIDRVVDFLDESLEGVDRPAEP